MDSAARDRKDKYLPRPFTQIKKILNILLERYHEYKWWKHKRQTERKNTVYCKKTVGDWKYNTWQKLC